LELRPPSHVVEQPEEAIVTYQSDLNIIRRNDMNDDTKCTHWIIGGVVALAMVIAALAFTDTGNYPNWPQTTMVGAAPSPSMTDSDAAPQLRPLVRTFVFRSAETMDA
jgi:hypothetical protein